MMDGLPKRKSNRLPRFDYGTVGAYFITICAREKKKVFGRVVGGGVLDAPRVSPSPHGEIVIAQLEAMTNFYPGLQIEKFVVMPNHIHLIVAVTQSPTGASRTPPPTTRACQSIHSGICFHAQAHDKPRSRHTTVAARVLRPHHPRPTRL